MRDATGRALMVALPLVLFCSFCLVVGTSAAVFSAWSCRTYQDDAARGTHQSFLRDDPAVRCSDGGFVNPAYEDIRHIATVFVAIWPLGLPITYVALLIPCRAALVHNRQTPLRRATAFLHREYLSLIHI